MVIQIASATTEVIGGTPLGVPPTQLPRWARTEELAGVAVADLDAMLTALHPMFVQACAGPQLYVWISL